MSLYLRVRVSEELYYPIDTEKLEHSYPADLPNIEYARLIADNDATVELTEKDSTPLVQFSNEGEIASLFCFIYSEQEWFFYLCEILDSSECEDILLNRLDLVSELLSETDAHLRDILDLFEEYEPAKVQRLIDRHGIPKVFRDAEECVSDYLEDALDSEQLYYFDSDSYFRDCIRRNSNSVFETNNIIWVFSY